jgi:anaerobic magnesium-protoporphyrin IX monomethyl ester cyclase
MKTPSIALISLYGVENTGVRAISSVLQADGFDTSIIFFKRWGNNDVRLPTEKEIEVLISLLKELRANIIGISFTSPFLNIAAKLTNRLKDRLGVTVVWGGHHATVRPQECLRSCDIVCRGEGEYPMRDIARAYASCASLENIKNLCYRQQEKIIIEELRPLIKDLDSLPHYDCAGENKFFIEGGKVSNADPLIHARELRVFASRGCPFACSYCYSSIYRQLYASERYHRIKSVENVISEIEFALGRFKKIRKIKFDDDTFIFPKDWIGEFCRKYRSRIGLPFEILFNTELLDKQALADLKTAGLRRVQVGIQTGSEKESLESYNRDLPSVNIKQFARISRALRLEVVYDIMLDNPMASSEDRGLLIDFLLSLPRPFDVFIYSLTVFPGTRLCELLLEKGLIRPADIEGASCKSFYQFRLNFSYPRPKDELFTACIVSLTSKAFIPKTIITAFRRSRFLKAHPLPLRRFAELCNMVKLAHILLKMCMQGEISAWKIKEYGSIRRVLIQ